MRLNQGNWTEPMGTSQSMRVEGAGKVGEWGLTEVPKHRNSQPGRKRSVQI